MDNFEIKIDRESVKKALSTCAQFGAAGICARACGMFYSKKFKVLSILAGIGIGIEVGDVAKEGMSKWVQSFYDVYDLIKEKIEIHKEDSEEVEA